jgi:hypothetical protein
MRAWKGIVQTVGYFQMEFKNMLRLPLDGIYIAAW